MRAGIAFIALTLAACGQPAPSSSEAPVAASSSDAMIVNCANFNNLTPDALAQRFGAENITTQTLPGPEGESYEATVVFPDDNARRVEIVWNDARTAPAAVSVETPGTQWATGEGITIGTPIADVERINVMPFKLWGFGWDYGGWVSDWSVGTLSQSLVSGCRMRIRFAARTDPGAGASGDRELNSNDQAVRDADPAVSEFGLLFATSSSGDAQ